MSWTPLAPRATLRTKIMAFLILMASLSVPVYSTPAHAALGTVGPLDPATKFPFWYQEQDARALRLGYCFDPVFCVAGTELPDPTKPPSVPNNFPEETFYWAAEASRPTNNGGQALMVLGLEGAFLPGPGVVDGQQVTFGRIRFRLDNLKQGADYTITYPYGVVTFTATKDGVRGINDTTDIGCGAAAAGVTCDFTLALNSSILQRFLTWDTYGAAVDAPPAGYIGNFSVPHRVTGSPNIMPGFPTGTNFFRVEGPDVGGPGVNSIETDQFQLAGHISGVAVTASPSGGLFNTAQAVRLTASDPGATIFFTTDGTTPTTASTKYTGTPIDITATTTLKYMAEAQGNQSPVGAQTYTIDTVPPVVSLTAKPATATNKANPSFTFPADKAGTTFACSLA
ncbi:MAG TPA: chitobiase/beta-hexosaminidase C-terminal domain-containing protein, partial [Chloroflexota bacterium]|nr:chitobiase/beta-hexosaminidase C-terminal domain-containing protein [Chloroflexota bacterium]